MSLLPNIETLDADGAIREAAAEVDGDTRAAFLRKAGLGTGAVLTSGAIMGMLPELAAAAKPSKKNDIKILNFALTLEFLEAAFYDEARKASGITGEAKAFAELVFAHENTHVKTLKSVLGKKAVSKPDFDFQGTTQDQTKFLQTAYVLENTGVHAYLGQAGNLKQKPLLAAAATIVTVEARHAAAVARLINSDPYADKSDLSITPDGAFDVPFSKKKILKALEGTGFIQS